jgi:gliding motility-associated-like protein
LQPTANQPGTYTLTVVNEGNGCQNTAQINVLENTTPPTAIANTDEEFDCITESVALDGNGSSVGSQFVYQWTGNNPINNSGSLSPTVFSAGIYTLLVTNTENGCTESADILVTENENVPTAAELVVDDPDCFGNQGSLTIFSVTGGQEPYLYSIDGGQNFGFSNIFPNLQPGQYNLLIQDAIGCEYGELVTIQPVVELFVDIQSEVTLQLGEDFQIYAATNIPIPEIDTIIWSPADGLSCSNCLNPTVENIIQASEYTVTIIDENGCMATDQIQLKIDKTREVFIPNVFSPNADGTNDLFMIFANNDKVSQINTFRIFDRWGEIVFEANDFQPNDPDYGWAGIFKGEDLNPAVFVYFAEIEFIDGVTQIYKGDVALMK